MTTGWLLLQLVLSSHSVDSQSTTDNETHEVAGLQQMLQTLFDNQRQIFQILRQQQTVLNSRGKYTHLLHLLREIYATHLRSDAVVSRVTKISKFRTCESVFAI